MNNIKEYLQAIDEVIEAGQYKDNWQSLAKYPVAKWFREAKLGAFIHWGVYSVPEYGNEWYSRWMYVLGKKEYFHHKSKYGDQAEFGYADFIPMFKAEKFDAEKWMDALEGAGMKYVTPVAEHHDGFKMYESKLSRWNSVEMGPKKDVLGELCKSGERVGLKVGASHHRAEHFWFMNGMRHLGIYPTDPDLQEFYGPCTESQKSRLSHGCDIVPTKEWCEDWLATACEIVDKYRPKQFYFDWWVKQAPFRPYLKKFAAYYYNRSVEWGEEVVLFYKNESYMKGAAVYDVERGAPDQITQEAFQTCTAIARNSWSYTRGNKFKSPLSIILTFIDIISKNGCLMLNVGPHANGEICSEELEVLKALGRFTRLNSEGIYGTDTYFAFGEGRTRVKRGLFGTFGEKDTRYTSKDFRFTYKQGALYAFAMKPNKKGEYLIKTVGSKMHKKGQRLLLVQNVSVLGYDNEVLFEKTGKGLAVKIKGNIPIDLPLCFKIEID